MKAKFNMQALSEMGRIILFGSAIESNWTKFNDIDIALVVRDGTLVDATEVLSVALRRSELSHWCFVQHLIAYSKKRSFSCNHVLHILVCEERDLLSGHPITNAVARGTVLSFRNAA
jgi:hypothetical protein